MKTIIMNQTVPLLCKTNEEFTALLNQGFKLKKTKNKIQYLIKEENEQN